MAKFLTLNTHSWMEDEQEKKLDQLAERILQEKYDVICLQEVNQEMESEQVVQAPFYHAVDGAIAIHKDHFAHCLVERLIEKGLIYHWSWAYNHIGFDRFHEGVAILSLKPLKPSELLVSDANDPTDYHTRKVLLAETEVDGRLVTVASCHLSWWDKGFQEEWVQVEKELLQRDMPLVLMGDFNNPVGYEGYRHILKSPLALQDSHVVAATVIGTATVEGDIAGWAGNKDALKIDYIFTSKDFNVKKSAVVFDGKATPVVSDHFVLEAEVAF